MKFSQILKDLRDEKEWNQEKLAKAINVSRSSITQYETDRNFPTADILEKIANVFDVSIDYLLGRTKYKKPILSKEDFEESLLASEFAKKYVSLTDEQKKTLNSLIEVWEKEKYEKK